MSKRHTPTCADCYFRRAGLCALPGETICPTFRVQSVGRSDASAAAASRPAAHCRSRRRVVPRIRACAMRRPRIDTDEVSDRWQPRLYLRLIAPRPARRLRDRLHPREPEAGERPLRARHGERVARLADPARARRRAARRDPARAARASPAPPLAPGSRALTRLRRSRPGETKLKARRSARSPPRPPGKKSVPLTKVTPAASASASSSPLGGPDGKLDPDEVAAVGPRPGRVLGKLALERLEHRVAPRARAGR